MRRKLAAGNWKMNGTTDSLREIASLAEAHAGATCEVLICPPATLIAPAVALAGQNRDQNGGQLSIGGQDCHAAASGAHTGDISAQMLRDAGAGHVILGHSERREDHGEQDTDVRDKARSAIAAGLTVIICVGESLGQREAQNTLDIISGQLAGSIPDGVNGTNLVVAYEPIWAIGTGKVPSTDQIGEVHDHIRTRLEERFGAGIGRSVRLLYGGSVKGSNAKEIFAVSNVDGALVGGASLTAEDFSPIVTALDAAG